MSGAFWTQGLLSLQGVPKRSIELVDPITAAQVGAAQFGAAQFGAIKGRFRGDGLPLAPLYQAAVDEGSTCFGGGLFNPSVFNRSSEFEWRRSLAARAPRAKNLIPRIEGSSREGWIRRYLAALNSDGDYLGLHGQSSILTEALTGASAFASFSPDGSGVAFAVIANRPGHRLAGDPFLRNVLTSLTEVGAQPYIIPLGLELVLSPTELENYHRQVTQSFSGMLAIGGGDIDPSL
jgi:hypothetical protein